MASILSNAPPSRSKPTRPPPNSSKPLQASSRLTPSSSTHATASTASQLPSTVSNVSLFLTNLRLLDLDLHPDWPDINPLTFTAKDAAQGQKKRIQCVEWALYQLFRLWDPEEARNKLQPFFPPLDQVQSLNLRAALLRSLEQAKKNGVLGRDVVIRKTMLDECKGDRLEEVLAVFSSAVLKKLVAEQQLDQPEHPALALTMALENRGYSGQTTDLSVLALAHRVSLSRHLRDKNVARARFQDFSELLDLKERTLARRHEQAKALEAQETERGALAQINDDVKHEVWRTVRNNWSGDERWMETLLYGDVRFRKDGLLSTPFDKVWRRVQSGRVMELEDPADGLLHQLDRRVKTQKERLEKWRLFRAEIIGAPPDSTVNSKVDSSAIQKGIDLGFGAHENLHLGRLSPRKLPRGKPAQLTDEYSDIIDSLRKELAQSSQTTAPARFHNPGLREKTTSDCLEPPADEVISEISELEEEDNGAFHSHDEYEKPDRLDSKLPAEINRSATLCTAEPEALKEEQMPIRPKRSSTLQSKPLVVMDELGNPPITASPTEETYRPTTPVSQSTQRQPPSLQASPPKPSPPKLPQASPERPVSPTQELADQILASMNAASPSPVKKPRHTLSLAERTRLSMARRNSRGPSLEDDDDDDEPDLATLGLPRPPTVTISGAQPDRPHAVLAAAARAEEPGAAEHGYEDLVSRTRRSMAGFDAARKKAQLERRRSQRVSSRLAGSTSMAHRRDGSAYFPSVDEEEAAGGADTTLLLAEELMNNEQDDYEAIFKSRPKIKTSPVGTPVRGWED